MERTEPMMVCGRVNSQITTIGFFLGPFDAAFDASTTGSIAPPAVASAPPDDIRSRSLRDPSVVVLAI